MADQSLAPETAFTVASTFLAYYYSEFVKLNELARMSDLYDERSYMTLVDFRDELPVVAHGRNAVANLLAKLDGSLGQRKVEIITVDTVALPHNCVQVICQGVMYLREYRRVFLHVFVLEPTAYRTKTYHISSDYLRFVDSEKEVIPEGAVVIAADQVASYLEESRRRIEEEQRRQLAEFQQRIRAQHEAVAAAAAAAAAAQQAQKQAAAAAAMRIPQPASRQGRAAQQPQPQPRSGAPAEGERRERRERPPREHAHKDANASAPANANAPAHAGRRHNEEGRPERKLREHREPREPREPRAEGRAEGRPEGRPERKPREQREQKPADRNKDKSAAAAAEAGDRRKKNAPATAAAPAADGAAGATPAQERKPRRENGPSDACILLRVPKKIKLSDIRAELESQGGAKPTDTFWCGPDSAHAVLKFNSVEEATQLFNKKVFRIQEEKITVRYYNP